MTSRRRHPLRDLALATSTLTGVPLRVEWPADASTDAPGYYPLVGAVIGALGFGFARLALLLGLSERAPLVAGAALVALWALVTRMLHWDGLGDVADALGTFDRERRLEIMRDSSIGAFAVTAIAVCVVAQSAALGSLMGTGGTWTLIAVPALARFAATCAAWFGKPARNEGLGFSVIGRPRVGALLPALVSLAALGWLCFETGGAPGLWLVGTGIALALVVPHMISLRIGGVTGDVMGASVVLVETILFAGCAVWL